MPGTTAVSSLPFPSLTDAPNVPNDISNLAVALDRLVRPKYASALAQTTANPAPADGDNWYRTDLSQGFKKKGAITVAEGDSYGIIGQPMNTNSSPTQLVWSSIPQTFAHLLIVWELGTNGTGSPNHYQDMQMVFNNAGPTNYGTGHIFGIGGASSATIYSESSKPYMRAGYLFDNATPAFGRGHIFIANYTLNGYQGITWQSGAVDGGLGAGTNMQFGSGSAASNLLAPVTQIMIAPTAGGGTFKPGGLATLYGLG